MGFGATFRHLFHPQRSNNHRARVLHPEALSFLIGISILFVGSVFTLPKVSDKAGEVLGFSSSITPSEVVTLTNAERAKAGLEPLKVNSTLNEAALMKAQDMFNQQYWAHNSPSGVQPWAFFERSKYEYSIAGENLARDFSNSQNMMQAWMNSPTHKANIVQSKYQEIGVAVVDGKMQGVETTLVVQFFGSPLHSTAQIPIKSAIDEQTDKATKKIKEMANSMETLSFTEQTPEKAPAAAAAEAANQAKHIPGAPEVLSSMSFRMTDLTPPPLLSPLQMTKAFFLAILCIVALTLLYDVAVMQYQSTSRIVGKNFAHLLFLGVIIFLVIYFKSGAIY